MDLEEYFRARLLGRPFEIDDYRADNYEFFDRNSKLIDEIVPLIPIDIQAIVDVGAGDALWSREIQKHIRVPIVALEKRQEFLRGLSFHHRVFPVQVNLEDTKVLAVRKAVYVFANVLHVLRKPILLLRSVPEGSIVVVIDTFADWIWRERFKLNSVKDSEIYIEVHSKSEWGTLTEGQRWILFFDEYLDRINATRLPVMSELRRICFDWKCLGSKLNSRKFELGYIVWQAGDEV